MWINVRELIVQGPQAVATLPEAAADERRGSRRDWFRERAMTTPGKLVLLAAALVVAAVCLGAVGWVSERSYGRAAQAARTETEPLLHQSVTLYTSLSDANATVTATFLRGGTESPARRAQYERDLLIANDALSALTREVGASPAARSAVTRLAEQLPVYTGRVEEARANNLQGFPVGAAYLRQASALLTGSMLPEADRIYAMEATRLASNYASATAPAPAVIIAAIAAVAMLLLLGAQLYLARISRRVLNLWMLGATAVLAVVSVWALVGVLREGSALTTARRASDAVEVLSGSRVLVSRAQSDVSLTLANRGGDETDPTDFRAVIKAAAPSGGLLGFLSLAGGHSGRAGAATLDASFNGYRAAANRVFALQDQGQTVSAIALATSPSLVGNADHLDRTLAAMTGAAQRRFRRAGTDATSALFGLSIGIPLLSVLAAALAVVGVGRRLGEYR